MSEQLSLADTLRAFMQHERRSVPDLAALTRISARTIEKWLRGEAKRPRVVTDLLLVAAKLPLDDTDTDHLLASAAHASLATLREQALRANDQKVLDALQPWHEPILPSPQPLDMEAATQTRLQALISLYNRRVFDDRRAGFVGRTTELGEVHERIEVLRGTGGYLAITGPAGEGKSSLIAKLIESYGEATTAYHFISFSPGADEQINVLQSLLAKLLLKHKHVDHADSYIPVNVQLPTLCNSLQYLLDQLHQLGTQEVIFIDGLDQIRPDLRIGERDLSFLPDVLPPGIVIVVGTRPDDTLKPLERRAQLESYALPPFSLDDFAVLLRTRQADLPPDQRTTLYTALHGNAFDLDFAAKRIAATAETELNALLTAIKQNPHRLFDLAFDRLKRDRTWRQAIKPVLGCLLATTLVRAPSCAVRHRSAAPARLRSDRRSGRYADGRRVVSGRPRYGRPGARPWRFGLARSSTACAGGAEPGSRTATDARRRAGGSRRDRALGRPRAAHHRHR